jgi:hypothetical protein
MSAPRVVLRHPPMCAMWLALMAIAFGVIALGLFVLHWPARSFALDACFLLYAAQGLMAELLGVAIEPTAIVAPRRLLSSLPFVVFWRKRIALDDIEKIKSMPRLAGLERAVVVRCDDPTPILFQDRDDRLYFFELVRRFGPWVNIYRGR